MTPWWQLNASRAKLVDSALAGQIDLARSHEGLALAAAGGVSLRILGVALGDREPLDLSHLQAYVRGTDLVATYGEVPPRNLRAQVYWRRLRSADFTPGAAQVIAAFDLIVSVNTSLLDADPGASVRGDIPAPTVLSLDRTGLRFGAISSQPSARTLTPENAAGCLLIPLVGSDLSYLEMVHPQDFNRSTIGLAAGGRIEVAHHLFQQRLEKGVILRARLRAAVLASEDSEATAAAAYQRFAASEAPLTV